MGAKGAVEIIFRGKDPAKEEAGYRRTAQAHISA
jgi:hypothetical protein